MTNLRALFLCECPKHAQTSLTCSAAHSSTPGRFRQPRLTSTIAISHHSPNTAGTFSLVPAPPTSGLLSPKRLWADTGRQLLLRTHRRALPSRRTVPPRHNRNFLPAAGSLATRRRRIVLVAVRISVARTLPAPALLQLLRLLIHPIRLVAVPLSTITAGITATAAGFVGN